MFYHALTGNGGTAPTEDLEPVLLWTNSNPTAGFTPQTVSLNLSDYAGVIIEFASTTTNTRLVSRIFIKKTDNTELYGGSYLNLSGTGYGICRKVSISDTGVVFDNTIANGVVSNNSLIPNKIYGVKEYVIEPVNNLQYITSLEGKTISFNAEENVTYLVIESAYNGSGAVSIRECSVDNGELELLKHAVQSKLETYTALIKNAVGTVNYSSAATSDGAMILIFKLVG